MNQTLILHLIELLMLLQMVEWNRESRQHQKSGDL